MTLTTLLPAAVTFGALLASAVTSLMAQSDTPAISARAAAPDTVDAATYEGWKHYRLVCDRCHGEEARGTSFGPDLLPALKSSGSVPTLGAFTALLATGRPDKGMPPATSLGLSPDHFPGIYSYLSGRSAGRYAGGRPVRQGN